MCYCDCTKYVLELYGRVANYLLNRINLFLFTVRASSGRPAYKSPEEYYDEVIALKKQIQDLNSTNSTLKLKIRRLEEDNLKKEKEIDQLLDPSKSDEMRRTLSEKRPDSSTVSFYVH